MSKRQYKCSYCGEYGHNRRSCPLLAKHRAEGLKGDSVSNVETESKENSPGNFSTAREKKDSEMTTKTATKPAKKTTKKKAKVKKVIARKQPTLRNKAAEPENEPEIVEETKPAKKTRKKAKPAAKKPEKPEEAEAPKTRGRKKVLDYPTKLSAFMLGEKHKKRLEEFAEQLHAIQTKRKPEEKLPKGASAGLRHILDHVSDDELRRIAKRSA